MRYLKGFLAGSALGLSTLPLAFSGLVLYNVARKMTWREIANFDPEPIIWLTIAAIGLIVVVGLWTFAAPDDQGASRLKSRGLNGR